MDIVITEFGKVARQQHQNRPNLTKYEELYSTKKTLDAIQLKKIDFALLEFETNVKYICTNDYKYSLIDLDDNTILDFGRYFLNGTNIYFTHRNEDNLLIEKKQLSNLIYQNV